jgi:hypothetical protein
MSFLEWFIAGPAIFAAVRPEDEELRRAMEDALNENKKVIEEIVPVRRALQDTIINALKEVAIETASRISKVENIH